MDSTPLYANFPPAVHYKSQSWLRGWWREILCITSSLICTAGIVAILALMREQPLSRWVVPYLSLPAALSIVSTVSKSTTALAVTATISQYKWIRFKKGAQRLSDFDLLDQASRGPNGSLWLLLTRPGMLLASLGALVTVLAVGLDPTIQQIINFTTRGVEESDGKASFGLAHTYIGDTIPSESNHFPTNLVDYPNNGLPLEMKVEPSSADLAMRGAIYRGLFNLESPPVFNCTSNCTWPDSYYTLGFSNTCADVTDVTFANAKAKLLFGYRNAKGGNLTTPGGIRLDAGYSETSWQPIVIVNTRPLMTAPPPAQASEPIRVSTLLARIAVFRTELDSLYPRVWRNGTEIVECDINLVVYKYSNITVENNKAEFGARETVPLEPGFLEPEKGMKKFDSAGILRTTWVTFNQTGIPPMTVSSQYLTALLVFFTSDHFVGTIYGGESAPRSLGAGEALQTGNITHLMENMAQSMTEHLQTRADHANAEGVSIYPVVHVQVRWEWLTPMLVIQTTALLFCCAIMVRSSMTEGLLLWKDSSIAVLYHDLTERDDGVEGVYIDGPAVKSRKELEGIAKRWKGSLR